MVDGKGVSQGVGASALPPGQGPTHLTWKRKLAFALVTFAAGFGVLFAAAEAYLRVTERNVDLRDLTRVRARRGSMEKWAQVDAYCAYRGRPGLYKGRVTKTVNKQGFISTPPIAAGPHPGTVRLAFLGASSTAGTGHDLPDDETWPVKTVELLRKGVPGARIDFINAALGGYTSFESFGRLWSRVRFYQPDVVVVYHGWNEMYYFQPSDMARIQDRRTLPDGSWSLADVSASFRLYDPLSIDPLIAWSQLLVRVRLHFSQPVAGETSAGGKTAALAADWDPRAPEVWRGNLSLIRAACDMMGARLFVARQATLMKPDLPPAERERCKCELHGFDYDAHLRAWDAIYRVIGQVIPPEGVIDATVLSGRPELFFDHVHPTPEGTSEIARIMAEQLAPCVRELSATGRIAGQVQNGGHIAMDGIP